MKMPTHLTWGTRYSSGQGAMESKPEVGDRSGGKHFFSYLIKPGLVLTVFKHSGVEGEPWRGEENQVGCSEVRGSRGSRHGLGLHSTSGSETLGSGSAGVASVEHSLRALPGTGTRICEGMSTPGTAACVRSGSRGYTA